MVVALVLVAQQEEHLEKTLFFQRLLPQEVVVEEPRVLTTLV